MCGMTGTETISVGEGCVRAQAGWRRTESIAQEILLVTMSNSGMKQRGPFHQMAAYYDAVALAATLICSLDPLQSIQILDGAQHIHLG